MNTGMKAALARLSIVATAIVAGWSAPAHAQAPGDSIRTRFGWRAGTDARVEAVRYRERLTEKADTQLLRLTYDMHVRSAPDGLLVQYDDFAFGAEPAATAELQQLLARLSVLSPSILVSGAGEFLSIEGVDRLRAVLDSLIQPEPAAEPLPPQMRQMMESLLSPAVLEAAAAQEWNAMVATWAGAAFIPGEVLEAEAEEPVPLFGGATLPFVYQFTLHGRKPCTASETELRCVELEMRSYPDPEAMASLLEKFLDQLALLPSSELPKFEELEMENQVLLVAEPETLLPHALTIVKVVKGKVRAGETTLPMSQLDQRELRFTYRAR